MQHNEGEDIWKSKWFLEKLLGSWPQHNQFS